MTQPSIPPRHDETPEVSGRKVVLIMMALAILVGLSALLGQLLRAEEETEAPARRHGVEPAPPEADAGVDAAP